MKSKLVIVDARCSEKIFEQLTLYADEVFRFQTSDVTYSSISCHPDIFIFQEREELIIAPNAPQNLFQKLDELAIPYRYGDSVVGKELHNSCFYNALATPTCFFHRKGYTDAKVLERQEGKQKIFLPQSYTRCSLLALTDEAFITSDAGIHKELQKHSFSTCYFSPEEIKIETHRYGFLGGTCGLHQDKLFFLGNPLKHKDGKKLCDFIESHQIEIISLADDYLYDGGGLFFVGEE